MVQGFVQSQFVASGCFICAGLVRSPAITPQANTSSWKHQFVNVSRLLFLFFDQFISWIRLINQASFYMRTHTHANCKIASTTREWS